MKIDYHSAGIHIGEAARYMAMATGYTMGKQGDHGTPVHWHDQAIEQLTEGLVKMGFKMVKVEAEETTPPPHDPEPETIAF